jgi:predicted dehydrogenase
MNAYTRRSFLARATLATGAISAFPAIGLSAAGSANCDIRVAIIGNKGKGGQHIEVFKELPGVRVVALCDADREVMKRGLEKLGKDYAGVTEHVDMREVLDRKDVDAVVIATPDHWHALATIWACQAGKDVYVEKPLSHDIWEGRKMIEAAAKYQRIVQPGTQSRTDPALKEAFGFLQEGKLGKMKLIRVLGYKRRPSIGKVSGPQHVPASVDYNLWCGPAAMEPLMRKSLHYDWHWVWSTGTGDIGNQGIHEVDMAVWLSGQKQMARRVMCLGGRFGYDDDGVTPNTQLVTFDNGLVPIVVEVRGLPISHGDINDGEVMDNYKGTRIGVVVDCEGGYFAGGAGGGWAYDQNGKKLKQFAGPGGRDHQLNFIQAVRSRKPQDLNTSVEQCHYSSAMCHMANISYRVGQQAGVAQAQEALKSDPVANEAFERIQAHLKANEVDLRKHLVTLGPSLEMDGDKERFTGPWSEEANMLIRRVYREPFAVRDKV